MSQVQANTEMETDQNSEHQNSDLSEFEKRMIAVLNSSINQTIKSTLKQEINEVRTEISNEIKLTLGHQDQKISEIERDYQVLQEKFVVQKHYIEQLEVQCKAKNIIILDLADNDKETNTQLKAKVQKRLNDLAGQVCPIDVIYRIGEFRADNKRPIRVKFERESDRNLVFSKRAELPQPTIIKSDTPEGMRIDHALLFGKQAELKESGTESTINFKKRCLETTDGEVFSVSDGVLRDADNTPLVTASKAKPRKKQKINVPNPNFLGKEQLRQNPSKLQQNQGQNPNPDSGNG